MSKKDERLKAKNEKDLEDPADAEDEEEDEEEEEEVAAAPAKPVERARRGHAQAKAHDHDHGHGHGAKAGGADAVPPDQDDAYWWAPHAVLGALLLVGMLGFFGLFNNTPLARIATPVAPAPDEHHDAKPAAAAPAPTPQQPQRPQQPQNPMGQQQQQREVFGAKHLLVMYKGSRRAPPTIERTQDEAKARATEAMKKAKADPAKFADIVKEYSDEPGAGARGGDLGKFPKGAMVPEFQAAVEKIKVGEISDLVETPFGYHVILRTQ